MRQKLARHELALVGGLLLVYYHALSLAIPRVPYIPLLLIYPAILGLLGLFLYGFRFPPTTHLRLYAKSYQTRFLLFVLALAPMLVNGIFRGNGVFHLGTELGFFLLFAFFLLIGGHDRVWHVIDRPMTIMVYVAFVLMLIFKETVAFPHIGDSYDANLRFTNTVAYGLRPMMVPAIFIFIWGCVNRRARLWKSLQIGTIVPLLVSEVGLFQFRSALGVILLAVALILVLYPFLQRRRIRAVNYIFMCIMAIIAFGVFLQSDYWDGFMNRVDHTRAHQTSIFASRQFELEVFLSEMGLDVIWGRGLGGSFDASSVYLRQDNSDRWRTVHFGIFSLVLRGGYLFLALILSFFLPVLRRKHPLWYDNPCNIASVLFIPLILANLLMAPFLVSLSFFLRYIWFALALAGLGTICNPSQQAKRHLSSNSNAILSHFGQAHRTGPNSFHIGSDV